MYDTDDVRHIALAVPLPRSQSCRRNQRNGPRQQQAHLSVHTPWRRRLVLQRRRCATMSCSAWSASSATARRGGAARDACTSPPRGCTRANNAALAQPRTAPRRRFARRADHGGAGPVRRGRGAGGADARCGCRRRQGWRRRERQSEPQARSGLVAPGTAAALAARGRRGACGVTRVALCGGAERAATQACDGDALEAGPKGSPSPALDRMHAREAEHYDRRHAGAQKRASVVGTASYRHTLMRCALHCAL